MGYNIILGSLGLGHQGRCGVLQLPDGHLGAMEQGYPSGDVLRSYGRSMETLGKHHV